PDSRWTRRPRSLARGTSWAGKRKAGRSSRTPWNAAIHRRFRLRRSRLAFDGRPDSRTRSGRADRGHSRAARPGQANGKREGVPALHGMRRFIAAFGCGAAALRLTAARTAGLAVDAPTEVTRARHVLGRQTESGKEFP